MPPLAGREQTIAGSDNVSITVTVTDVEIVFHYLSAGPFEGSQNIFLALGTHHEIGAAVLPFAPHREGSTVFLPFKADHLLSVEITSGEVRSSMRKWERWRWNEPEQIEAVTLNANGELLFRVPRAFL